MTNLTRSKKRSNQRKSIKRNKRSYKKSKKQRGGADFSQAQRQQLLDMGFTEDHIDTLTQVFPNTDSGVVMNLIQTSLGQINNNTGLPNTPQEIIDSLNPDNNENNLSVIGSENGSDVNNLSLGSFAFENENDISDIDYENNSQHNISDDSFVFNQDDLDNNLNNNIDDISEDSIVSNQGDTTREDSSLMDIAELNLGGKRRKTRKGRKGKKSRKTRKQRGGALYGTGVGANCFDPNYSIYNTPALSLFPYKPN